MPTSNVFPSQQPDMAFVRAQIQFCQFPDFLSLSRASCYPQDKAKIPFIFHTCPFLSLAISVAISSFAIHFSMRVPPSLITWLDLTGGGLRFSSGVFVLGSQLWHPPHPMASSASQASCCFNPYHTALKWSVDLFSPCCLCYYRICVPTEQVLGTQKGKTFLRRMNKCLFPL